MPRILRTSLLLAAAAAVIGALALLLLERARLNAGFDPHQAGFTGSAACQDCHQDRHESWYATYHRTMTQEASPASVQGRFDGQALDYWGVRVRPVQDNGHYFFEYENLETGEQLARLEIERTVGSHRYQQYMTRLPDDGTYVRLHYLWHNGDQRWVHMNAAFLGPDEQGFDDQVSIWNQNCIFCHNTGPRPGMTNYQEMRARAAQGQPVSVTTDSRFQSTVAELGIACETCHGPGSGHVDKAQSLWTRIAMRLNGGRDSAIVNPARLDAQRASQVCGQCHGQRVPKTNDLLRQWVHEGPTFRAGLDLRDHVDPVWRDTRAPIEGHEDLFQNRFWADGTPRLSAYEFQGLMLSACHQEAELSCIDCHTVHAGDPAGQITDRNRGNAPCLRCHQDFRAEQDLVEHTRHDADSAGSLCYNCHMPDAAYGVMDIHRTHRIQPPDMLRDAGAGRSNACLTCHLDQSPVWAAQELGQDPSALARIDGTDPALAEAVIMLSGDPVQKAITAYRAGQPGAARGGERLWLLPYLLETLSDRYPSSRRFAQRSILAILDDLPPALALPQLHELITGFDFIADAPVRAGHLATVAAHWQALDKSAWPAPPASSGLDAAFNLPETLRESLLELGARQEKQISIGE